MTHSEQDTRAADRHAFNIAELRRSIVFRGVVIGRMQEDLNKPPARRIPESWAVYEARCRSRRVSIECAILREQEARTYEVGTLARYGVAL